tara:strand:+ start:83 stop:523 length:441 start_codon:yes stop_codon:yes gene_type:complete
MVEKEEEVKIYEKILDVLAEATEKNTFYTASAIAKKVKVSKGASGITIRDWITKTMDHYKVPLYSSSKGYRLMRTVDELEEVKLNLNERARSNIARRNRIEHYFYNMYGKPKHKKNFDSLNEVREHLLEIDKLVALGFKQLEKYDI